MSAILHNQRLGAVFQSRPDILDGIKKAADTPARVTLFNNIASFVYDQINDSEPAAKRRRIDNGAAANCISVATPNGTAVSSSSSAEETVQLEIKEISVSVPQRKKYDLCFTNSHLYARAPGTTSPIPNITYAWKDIEYAFYLPVPEKTQVQHNYIIFPRGTALSAASPKPDTANKTTLAAEPLVFTVPSTPPKQGTITGPQSGRAASVSDNYRSLFDWALSTHFRAANPSSPVSIVAADSGKFHSVVKQPHRPKEKAVHVKAFRGSKDGYLFFLPTGILWGFKKPLMFMPLERIAAVSYTSVLQRTFNVVVEVITGGAGGDGTDVDETGEIEFAMLDQEDYQGIDENYVRRNRLQDMSMGEQRKAKLQLVENLKAKKGAGEGDDSSAAAGAGAGAVAGGVNGGLAGADGMTELERAHADAEQHLQDEEDEDEEDYNPESEDDSEGEGETSDDEDGDQDMEDGEDSDDEEE